RPFISVAEFIKPAVIFNKRLHGGEHSILIRAGQVLERSKGYRADTAATNYYPGSAQKLLVRYKYQFGNLLQYGVTGEKDAGEQFFKGRQKQGFDFYSVHFFARHINNIKAIALGDFTVNLGQGLVQWQSLAFKKSGEVMNIKREGPVLRPYNSPGEINFHRGAGITIGKKNWDASLFVSYKNIDANAVADTSQTHEDFISSLQTSGYHRTNRELNDKSIQKQLALGGNLLLQFKKLQLGINGIQYKFKLPFSKPAYPYNLYALTGKSFGNYSIDYSYTFKNVHLFGEAAITGDLKKALISGILLSTATDVDAGILYRNISAGYQSLYSSAFTENTYPNNEKGLYAGVTIHPALWQIDAYADVYKFPWLKYRVNMPSSGAGYLLQVTFKPNKQVEIYSRLRSEKSDINTNPNGLALAAVMAQVKQSWRTQFNYRLNKQVEITTRAEILQFNHGALDAEQGFLIWCSLFYKPALKTWTANMRWQYFETDGYNSRIYGYENDVLYGFSIPAIYYKGIRYYINVNYDFNKKWSFWMKWSQTIYKNKTLIGSGLDEINGGKKTEVRVQLMYKF
ncbi:MAG: hypothetical protein ABUT20_43885, partial [Bacteroidota bacterium]